jgi:hypothetical protein
MARRRPREPKGSGRSPRYALPPGGPCPRSRPERTPPSPRCSDRCPPRRRACGPARAGARRSPVRLRPRRRRSPRPPCTPRSRVPARLRRIRARQAWRRSRRRPRRPSCRPLRPCHRRGRKPSPRWARPAPSPSRPRRRGSRTSGAPRWERWRCAAAPLRTPCSTRSEPPRASDRRWAGPSNETDRRSPRPAAPRARPPSGRCGWTPPSRREPRHPPGRSPPSRTGAPCRHWAA